MVICHSVRENSLFSVFNVKLAGVRFNVPNFAELSD